MAKQDLTVSRRLLHRNALVLKVLYVLLVLRYAVLFLLLPPLGREPNPVMFGLAVIPLLVFAYGVFTEKRRHLAGFCYILIPYFIAMGANMFVPELILYVVPGLIILVAAFSSATLQVRWLRQGVTITNPSIPA